MTFLSKALRALALVVSMTGQSSAQAPAEPVLKVTTRLVQINVVVHDRHGSPVANLTKDDFQISDQGRWQVISTFSVDSAGAQTVTAGERVAVIPANEFTNRLDRQGNHPSGVTVILLDRHNTKFEDQAYARTQLYKFLKTVRPDDRVALYTMNGTSFKVLHDFTNNSSSLAASLAKFLPGFSTQLDASTFEAANTGSDNLDTQLDSINTTTANFFVRNRVLDTCLALQTLANHLAGFAGRKNLVWVSSGFPMIVGFGDTADAPGGAFQNLDTFTDAVEAASRAMSNANVAVYPVDARGLMGLPMADASRSFKIGRNGALPASAMHVDNRNQETMEFIADLTGGKAFYNTNDINGAIRHAIDDSAVTYTLGYYSPESNWDSKFHRIKVKVNGSGLSVRTKKGYFAQDATTLTGDRLTHAIRDAMWSPLDSTAVGVRASILPSQTEPFASHFQMHIDPQDLDFHEENGRFVGLVEVIFAQLTTKGQWLADERQTLNMHLTAATYQTLRKDGINAARDLKITPQTEAVRIIVVDRPSGGVGSVTIPVTARDKSGGLGGACGNQRGSLH